jgi:hypothetical protein
MTSTQTEPTANNDTTSTEQAPLAATQQHQSPIKPLLWVLGILALVILFGALNR